MKKILPLIGLVVGFLSINLTGIAAQNYYDSSSMHTIWYADQYYSLSQTKFITVAKYTGGTWQAGIRAPETGQQFIWRTSEISVISWTMGFEVEHGHSYR